jgi:hypothetical protein
MTGAVKVYRCKLCSREWDNLPADIESLTKHKRGGNGQTTVVRFADGAIHILVRKARSAGEKS